MTRCGNGTPERLEPERVSAAQSSGEWPGARITFLRGFAAEDVATVPAAAVRGAVGARDAEAGGRRDAVRLGAGLRLELVGCVRRVGLRLGRRLREAVGGVRRNEEEEFDVGTARFGERLGTGGGGISCESLGSGGGVVRMLVAFDAGCWLVLDVALVVGEESLSCGVSACSFSVGSGSEASITTEVAVPGFAALALAAWDSSPGVAVVACLSCCRRRQEEGRNSEKGHHCAL